MILEFPNVVADISESDMHLKILQELYEFTDPEGNALEEGIDLIHALQTFRKMFGNKAIRKDDDGNVLESISDIEERLTDNLFKAYSVPAVKRVQAEVINKNRSKGHYG
jgi:hypothetical protein